MLLVAADIYRPAAIDQLKVLGQTLGVDVFSIPGQRPQQLCTLAMHKARNQGFDVVIFDTAGRLAIDNDLMQKTRISSKNMRPTIFSLSVMP